MKYDKHNAKCAIAIELSEERKLPFAAHFAVLLFRVGITELTGHVNIDMRVHIRLIRVKLRPGIADF